MRHPATSTANTTPDDKDREHNMRHPDDEDRRDDACGRQRRRRACGNLQVVRTKQGGYGTHKPMSAEEVQERKDAT
ncbi:hypothetical protein VTO73DRAFT_4989 [Trametes versicolor]